MGHLISEPKFKILTPSPPPPLIPDKSLRKAHSELVLSPPIDVTDGPHQILLGFSPASYIVRISNGNRTEWSPIRSVIIRVINKIGRPHSGSPICLITSMITDRIGRHEVLLPINHNFNKICDI